jgi:hypothetical protein
MSNIDNLIGELRHQRARAEKAEARFTAPIVCICGSTRFKQSWIAENARLTSAGYIVLAVGLWGHHERVYPDEATKVKLDDLHKRKIDLCDWVWVLDVGGYIGESTRSEIEYAQKLGRPVRYLSREFPGYTEPVDPLQAEVARLRLDRHAWKRRWAERVRTGWGLRDEVARLWACIDELQCRLPGVLTYEDGNIDTLERALGIETAREGQEEK